MIFCYFLGLFYKIFLKFPSGFWLYQYQYIWIVNSNSTRKRKKDRKYCLLFSISFVLRKQIYPQNMHLNLQF